MTERGDRVKLIHVNDPHTKLAPGTLGTVTSVDSLGTVHVKWDDGHHLGLVAEAGDAYRVIAQIDDPAWAQLVRDAADGDPGEAGEAEVLARYAATQQPSDAACMEADIEKLRRDDELKREARR